jgi:hypothetical protein
MTVVLTVMSSMVPHTINETSMGFGCCLGVNQYYGLD